MNLTPCERGVADPTTDDPRFRRQGCARSRSLGFTGSQSVALGMTCVFVITAALTGTGCVRRGMFSRGTLDDTERLPAEPSAEHGNTGNQTTETDPLEPGDEIRVQVFREPEISGIFRLTPEGVIRHPLLGSLALQGLMLGEAEEQVRQLLMADYLVNPRVILTVTQRREWDQSDKLHVLVMGEVKRPGAVAFVPDERLTLLDAIARAGGFTQGASRNRVRVVRTIDGEQRTLRIRVDDILTGKSGHENIDLQPDDVINIPEVWF